MLSPGLLPLAGDRNTPFTATLQMDEIDLTGATLAMQVRLYAGAVGAALANLALVVSDIEGIRIIYAGSATVSSHISAGRLTLADVPSGYATGDTLALTLIGIRIDEATMQAMPTSGRIGVDPVFAWDIHITASGGTTERSLYGPFTVREGVII
jgi:hypothetical protein